MIVDIKTKDERRKFLYFLEGKEFMAYHFTREHIVNSKLPFDINLEKKKFSLVKENDSNVELNEVSTISMNDAIDMINKM